MSLSNESTSSLIVVGEVTRENCELASMLNQSTWIFGVTVVHIVVSVCGLIAIYQYLKCKPIRKAMGLISVNLKIISALGLFYYFWGFVSSFLVYFYKLYLYARPPQPCDCIWNRDFCYILYSQHSSACFIGYTLFHIALLLERLYSMSSKTGRERASMFGVLLGLLIVVFPQLWTFAIYYPIYKKNGLLVDRVNCSSLIYNSPSTNGPIFRLFATLLIVDFVVTAGDFCLLLYNKFQIAKYYRKITVTYTLTKSFSLHESRLSIRLIYPFSVSHSISYSSVTLFYIFYLLQDTTPSVEMDQFWRETVHLMRTFNNFLLFLVLCFVHRQQQTSPNETDRDRTEADRYFQHFNQMIS